MHKREVYNANFMIGPQRHRVTRVAYSADEVAGSVKRDFPEASAIKVSRANGIFS